MQISELITRRASCPAIPQAVGFWWRGVSFTRSRKLTRKGDKMKAKYIVDGRYLTVAKKLGIDAIYTICDYNADTYYFDITGEEYARIRAEVVEHYGRR